MRFLLLPHQHARSSDTLIRYVAATWRKVSYPSYPYYIWSCCPHNVRSSCVSAASRPYRYAKWESQETTEDIEGSSNLWCYNSRGCKKKNQRAGRERNEEEGHRDKEEGSTGETRKERTTEGWNNRAKQTAKRDTWEEKKRAREEEKVQEKLRKA